MSAAVARLLFLIGGAGFIPAEPHRGKRVTLTRGSVGETGFPPRIVAEPVALPSTQPRDLPANRTSRSVGFRPTRAPCSAQSGHYETSTRGASRRRHAFPANCARRALPAAPATQPVPIADATL